LPRDRRNGTEWHNGTDGTGFGETFVTKPMAKIFSLRSPSAKNLMAAGAKRDLDKIETKNPVSEE
jgi:hypothetical protein